MIQQIHRYSFTSFHLGSDPQMTVRRAPTTEIMSESQVSQDILIYLASAGNYYNILASQVGARPDCKVSLSGKVSIIP